MRFNRTFPKQPLIGKFNVYLFPTVSNVPFSARAPYMTGVLSIKA